MLKQLTQSARKLSANRKARDQHLGNWSEHQFPSCWLRAIWRTESLFTVYQLTHPINVFFKTKIRKTFVRQKKMTSKLPGYSTRYSFPRVTSLIIIKDLMTGTHEPNKLTCFHLSGFIAQLVKNCTCIAEVLGSIPIGATWILQLTTDKRKLLKLCI